MTLITANDGITAISQGSRPVDYCQNGVFWTCLYDGNALELLFFYSLNDGFSWTESTTSSVAVQSSGKHSFFIDEDDYAHLVYRVSDTFWYARGTPNAERTSWTWSTPLTLASGVSALNTSTPGVVAVPEGSGWAAHAFHPRRSGSTTFQVWSQISITSGGTIALGTQTDLRSLGDSNIVASCDFRHTAANTKEIQSATPSVYVCYTTNLGTDALYFRKLAYSAGTWSAGTERTIDANAQNDSGMALFYDGTRIVMSHYRQGTLTVVRVDERDEADTATTNRDPTALADGNIDFLACGYDGANQNIWVLASGDTSNDVKKIRYNRGGAAWAGSWTVVASMTANIGDGGGMMLGLKGVLGAVYVNPDPATNEVTFEILVATWEGEALLQGVGSAAADAALGIGGQAALQGVGTILPTANLGFAAVASLQGVGSMSPDSQLTPFRDFTVYDGYIYGGGLPSPLGLIYFEGEGMRNSEVSQPLRPPRQDTGNEPTEVRPESGEIFSQQDFSNGSGQLYFHHEGRDIRRYLWSEGFDVDIDTVGRPATLLHLHDVPAPAYSSANVGEIVIFNDLPFVIDGTTFKRGDGDFPGAWTDDPPHAAEGAVTVNDAVSSGEYLYAALGANGIHRRDTAGIWTHWNDVQATRIAWVKNRIMAADGVSIYEVISSGAAPTPVETLPVGWAFQDIFEMSGYVYAIATNVTSRLTRIHAYGLNDDGSAVEKKSETPFPSDQVLLSGVGYLDTAFIGGGILTPEGGYDPVVYQANVVDRDRGALSYSKINEGEGAGAIDLSVLDFEPVGENVLCGWSLGSGFPFGARDGLALYKLKNGAFFPYLKISGAGFGRQIRSIASYKGRVLFTAKGSGLYYEDPSKYVLNAYLVSSVADWQTTAEKAWDTIEDSHNPLPAGSSVFYDYTTELPTSDQWTNAFMHSATGEETGQETFTDLTSRLLAIRIRSVAAPDQLDAPSGHGFLVRSNVLPDEAEWQLTRFVRLLKRDRKDEGGEDVFIADVHERKQELQATAYRWVTLWEAGVEWTVRVAQIANVTPLLPQFQETMGEERREAFVLQLSLEGVRD